ncbi:MAG TPA: helix-turn-helix transcriptional regulator [Thermoanaerobaculia bacterium]|nr:helix-turn-helix transcriptional regulator [Thermoanaerobaculia bacterium]
MGRKISILRIARGWSQDRLAQAAGITSSALSEYERGKKIPELKSLRKITSALGYSLSALDRAEDFLREIQAESILEARPEPEGGYTLVPVSLRPEGISATQSLRVQARRTAALMGQAATSFGVLLFDILMAGREGA